LRIRKSDQGEGSTRILVVRLGNASFFVYERFQQLLWRVLDGRQIDLQFRQASRVRLASGSPLSIGMVLTVVFGQRCGGAEASATRLPSD
jgi:hypothetical protein